MADRGHGAVRGARGTAGSRGRQGGPQGSHAAADKPKRESILDLSKYLGQNIKVKFTGGREVIGILKGYDQLLNLVLDEVEEEVDDPPKTGKKKRSLGLVVLRGPTITVLYPDDGSEEIANPFLAQT